MDVSGTYPGVEPPDHKAGIFRKIKLYADTCIFKKPQHGMVKLANWESEDHYSRASTAIN